MSCCLALTHQQTASYTVQDKTVFLLPPFCLLNFPIVQFLSFPSASLCPSLSGWLSVLTLHLLPHELAGSEGRGQQPFRIQGRRTACCIFTMSETGLKCVGRGSSHQSAAQTPSTRESEVKKKGQKNNKFLLSFKMDVVLHDRDQQCHQILSCFE